MLRNTVRPSDLVARLGGDEFAVWLNGADHMTAAERAEQLCIDVPRELREIAGDAGSSPSGVDRYRDTRRPAAMSRSTA